MPRQNRVTPWGEIIAVPDRGMFMGNRGCIHDANGRLTGKRWARTPWVICLLSFKDRQRQIMAPGMYTELFFLDEATALAAGHRPCATCRRDDYSRFKQLWEEVNTTSSIKELDNRLHQERFASGGWQEGWRPKLKDLPDGTFVVLDAPDTAWLVLGDELLEWSPGGYRGRIKRPANQTVTVLTPRSIVAVLDAGYVPQLHPSAGSTPIRKANQAKTVAPVRVMPKAPKPAPKVSTPKPVKTRPAEKASTLAGALYKLRKTPSGKALFAYMAAILKVTGMDQGKVYPLKKFLGNFSTHEQAGRIQKVPDGYQLTPAGIDYFNDRYNLGNRQHVVKSEVDALAQLIRKGGGADWVPVD